MKLILIGVHRIYTFLDYIHRPSQDACKTVRQERLILSWLRSMNSIVYYYFASSSRATNASIFLSTWEVEINR